MFCSVRVSDSSAMSSCSFYLTLLCSGAYSAVSSLGVEMIKSFNLLSALFLSFFLSHSTLVWPLPDIAGFVMAVLSDCPLQGCWCHYAHLTQMECCGLVLSWQDCVPDSLFCVCANQKRSSLLSAELQAVFPVLWRAADSTSSAFRWLPVLFWLQSLAKPSKRRSTS